MPRIAAALGVLATVAFCIGFNVQRYPVVLQSLTAMPTPPSGPDRSNAAAKPIRAIASAIRPAAGRTVAEAKGLPQPIPLPHVTGPSQPIPAPNPARMFASDEPVPDYEVVTGPTEKYAGLERPKESAPEKPKTAARGQKPEAKQPKPADTAKAKSTPAAKDKAPDKSKPIAADKNKPHTDKGKLQAQKVKPAPAEKAKAQPEKALASKSEKAKADKPKAEKPRPEKAQVQKSSPPKPQPVVAATEPKTSPAAKPAEPVARVVERPLVPVRRENFAVAQAQPGWNTSRSPWAMATTADRSIRRLPPVDARQASVANPFASQDGRFPFYPTTGW